MNKNVESYNELPSMAKLIKSTIIAIVTATAILITVVLPAEYGIDPTGVGEMIGLKKMGEIKVSLAQEADAEKITENNNAQDKVVDNKELIENKTSTTSTETINKDEFTITLEPNQGKEIKLAMLKGAQVNYNWFTNGGKANFDAHADSKPLAISYHNYEKGKFEKSKGVLTAAFDGNHGWFWRNRTSEPMTVTLEVNGAYTEVFQY